MNFYEGNLELFKTKIPMLYETVMNEKPIFDIGLEKIDDTLNYTIIKDEKKCFIHSLFDINEEMNQMFRKVEKDVETLIIFGLGCGYALNYIENNYKKMKNIIVIEPSLDIFKKFIRNVDIYEEIKQCENITFIVNKSTEYVSDLVFQYVRDKIANNIRIAYNISYRTVFYEYYEEINNKLVDFISKTAINLVTNNHFVKQWTYNPIINMTREGRLINNLFNKFDGKSAIIVSAGPSLNKNIHLLEYAKDKALIASVGTASRILESNNIKPHFRFAMHSSDEEKLIFDNMEKDNSVLVYSDRLQHEIVPLFKRRLKMILDLDYITKYIYNKSNIEFKTVRSGFSIANTALDTLIKLGFKNIIFVGQDMCFTKDKVYADGSCLEKNNVNVKNEKEYIETKDIYENVVYTDKSYLGFKSIFENIIKANSNIKYINATEGGLGLQGSIIKTFKQVLDEDLLEIYDYDSFFDGFFDNNNDNNIEFKKVFDTIIELEDDIDEMIKINDLRIRGLKKIDRYLNKGLGISKIEREIVYLNKYEEDLRKIHSYNNCIKLSMNDVYKVLLNKFKYEGEDSKEAILSSKKILECISYELRGYLFYFKNCIKEAKENV